MKPTVLLVGVTGMLGNKIAQAILAQNKLNLRALVRSANPSDAQKRQQLDELKAQGATFAEGDLMNPASLPEAMKGVEVILSAIGNDHETFVTGQLNLLAVGEKAGVKRFIPSDFSVDYRKLADEDNFNLAMRRQTLAAIEQSKLSYTLILNGAFMEMPVSPFINNFDLKNGTFNYWGEGDEPGDYTLTDDVAQYAAEAAADEDLTNQALEIAGEVISYRQMLATFEEVTGQKLQENRLGSAADLHAWIEKTKATAQAPWDYLAQQYTLNMITGKGKLDHLRNDRYPHIQPTTFREFFAQFKG